MAEAAILNVTFQHIQNMELQLDILYPEKGVAPYPVILYLHGGGWAWGNRQTRPVIRLVDDHLRVNGFVIVPIDYRLSGVATYPAQIEDCQAAVRWLRAHAEQYQLDPDRIGAWGFSSGAQLATLLGLIDTDDSVNESPQFSSKVQAVCAFAVTSDFLSFEAEIDEDHPIAKLFGGMPSEMSTLAIHASPITHVDGTTIPFYLIHGENDSVVPVNQSIMMHEALKDVGAESTLNIIPDGDHGLGGLDEATIFTISEQVLGFFQQHLGHR